MGSLAVQPPSGVTRNLTEVFIFLRNNKQQSQFLPSLEDSITDDRMALISSINEDRAMVTNTTSRNPPQWVNVIDEVNYEFTRIKSRITTLKEMENKQLSQPTFSADDSQQATPEQTKIKELTDEITKMFGHTRRLIRLLEDESHSQLESHEKMRQNVITSLMLSLNSLMNEFRSIQSNYLRHLDSNNNLDAFLVKSCSSWMQTDLSEINLTGEGSTEESELSINQLQQIIENEHMTKEREHEILRISKSILEMNSLFRDIATMIVDQGAILDRIDYNCEQSASRIKEAFKSVEKAEKYQRKNKKMHLIVVLAGFAIFLMLLIILIKF